MNPSFDRQSNRLEKQCQNWRLLIYYIKVLQRSETWVCVDLPLSCTKGTQHPLDMLKPYHLERETWKKGSMLAVLWARKLRAVAVTILPHHPLRPSALCVHWAWVQAASDSWACAGRGCDKGCGLHQHPVASGTVPQSMPPSQSPCCCRKSLYYM